MDVTPSNNFYLDFYVDRVPARYLIGDMEWGVQGEDMVAGTSQTFSGSFVFTGGSHNLYAQVDTDDTVDECPFEDNNILGPIPITASGSTNTTDGEQQVPQTDPNDGPRHTPTPVDLSEELAVPLEVERPLSTPTPIPIGTPPPAMVNI